MLCQVSRAEQATYGDTIRAEEERYGMMARAEHDKLSLLRAKPEAEGVAAHPANSAAAGREKRHQLAGGFALDSSFRLRVLSIRIRTNDTNLAGRLWAVPLLEKSVSPPKRTTPTRQAITLAVGLGSTWAILFERTG